MREAAGCTILAVPSFRDRIPVIADEVNTVTGSGELIDVVATERGIAINPTSSVSPRFPDFALPFMG